MTRKDYEVIAAAIRKSLNVWKTDEPRLAIAVTADCIADVMQRDNPRFDREKFLKASGVRPELSHHEHHKHQC